MDIYSFLRELADSWGLLALFVIFIGVIFFTFRPGSKAIYSDPADIPLRHGDDLEAEAKEAKKEAKP